MKKSCPASLGYPTRRGETTRPPELSHLPRRACKPNVNVWLIFQRNKLKVTLSRITRGRVVSGTRDDINGALLKHKFEQKYFGLSSTHQGDGCSDSIDKQRVLKGGPNPISQQIVFFFKSQLKVHNLSLCSSI